MTIRYSEISSFRRCQRKWYYEHFLELVLREQIVRMDKGSAGHKALEVLILGGTEEEARSAALKWFDDLRAEYGPNSPLTQEAAVDEAAGIAETALLAYETLGPVDPVKLDGQPLVELPVLVEVFGEEVRGTADAVLRWRDSGLTLVVDHKFRAGFRSDHTEGLNLQMAVYQSLLSKKGIETHGSLQHQVASRPPSRPSINKDGTVRRYSKLRSTWDIYSGVVLENGGNPADYEDMKSRLTYKPSDTSVRAYRSKQELENIWTIVVVQTVREIKEARAKARDGEQDRLHRCFVHEVCGSCQYKELCIEELKGGDSEFVKKTRYRHKDEPAGSLPIIFEEDEVLSD